MSTAFMRFVGAWLLFAVGASLALAHTSATSTTPATGSVLDASPATIGITFKEAARLTSVVVHRDGQPERKLTFTPNGSATEFNIDDPALEPGKSEVRWTALSKDGHVVKGVIVLTVKGPSAAKIQ
jgi:methionine-rich copper-binding protein CopC